VVGSSIVSRIAEGRGRQGLVKDVVEFCAELADSVHAART
jgi:tryptophan synthase alpha subunit